MSRTCFSIMPFGDDFEDIEDIFRESARRCKLEYIRGDLTDKPGSVIPQVLHEIKRAAVVLADITGHNPNVFYELGIAHQIKGPERVVIVTQKLDGKKAYDVHQFRQFVYSHNKAGRAKLLEELPRLIRKASDASADQEFWNVIKGRLPRTRMLVRDMQRLLDCADSNGLKGTTIRIAAGLSSLAISDNEPQDAKLGSEYHEALLAERDTLRKVLLKGASMKAVLNPPRRFTQAMLPERLYVRYRRLIGLLEGRSDIRRRPRDAAEDLKAIRHCHFALSPVPMPNVFIIGDHVAYEGMKRGGAGGFEMTHCETSAEGLKELIEQFDRYFEESYREMIRAHPPNGRLADQLQEFFLEATKFGKACDQSK